MDIADLHKNYSQGKFSEKINTLNLFLTLGTADRLDIKLPKEVKELVNVGVGLLVRSPKPLRETFLNGCNPHVKKIIFDTMKLPPKALGLAFDPAGDPKEIAALEKQDLETLSYYRDLIEKRKKGEEECAARKKKHDVEIEHAAQEVSHHRQEDQWKKMLHEVIHERVLNPLPLQIVDLVFHGKYDEAAKKFIAADLKVQKHVIDDIDGSKHKTDGMKFIEAIEHEIDMHAKAQGGGIDVDLPETCRRAKICIAYFKESLNTVKK